MKFLRWIAFCPVSVAAFIGCLYAVPFLLAWAYKIMYYIMFWGSKYDVAPVFEFEYAIEDFKAFIFITCLGLIISGCISGVIAGCIVPASNKRIIALAVYCIPMLVLLVLLGIGGWRIENWLYRICFEISVLFTAVGSAACMYAWHAEK